MLRTSVVVQHIPRVWRACVVHAAICQPWDGYHNLRSFTLYSTQSDLENMHKVKLNEKLNGKLTVKFITPGSI